MKNLSMYFVYLYAIVISMVLFSGTANAEQKKTLGDWEVHYIAFPSTFLTPEVARTNDIARSTTRAVVNISVLNSRTKEALDVEVSGSARNLLGTSKRLEFKTVKEGKAIYYLATISFDDKEMLRFNIDIDQGNVSQVLQFQQTMYEE